MDDFKAYKTIKVTPDDQELYIGHDGWLYMITRVKYTVPNGSVVTAMFFSKLFEVEE